MFFKKIIKKGLIITALSLSTPPLLAEELTNLNSQDIPQHLAHQNALVIDIRTAGEWEKTGIIPNSHPLTFFNRSGQYDVKKWLAEVKKLQTSSNQEIILVCRSGSRSQYAGNYLSKTLNLPNISHLEKGMNAWLSKGLPTEKICQAKRC